MLKTRTLVPWHRRIGLLAAVPFILLLLTGLLLNHTSELRLDQRKLQSHWLQHWYGMAPPAPGFAMLSAGHWYSQWQGQVFRDTYALLPLADGSLLAVVDAEPWLFLAGPQQLLIVQADGQILDRLAYPRAQPPSRIGSVAHGVVIEMPDGQSLGLNDDMTQWRALPPDTTPTWQQSATLPPSVESAIRAQLPDSGVSFERLMLDLHSGRFFGRFGIYVIDAAAILMLLLVLSGVITTLRRGRQQRR